MIREKLNGFITLKDVVYWIAIVAALIGPYLIHERRIADMQTDIALIKFQLGEVKVMVQKHLDESRGVSWSEEN
jgi:hypothetical protein